MFNGRPPQRLPPGSTRVGPPAHEEFIVKGPFQGFNGDMDNWHDLPLNVAQDCQNIDFYNGNIETRSGLVSIGSRTNISDGGAGTDYFSLEDVSLTDSFLGCVELPALDSTGPYRWQFLWDNYSVYWGNRFGGDAITSYGGKRNLTYQEGTAETFAASNVVTGVGTLWATVIRPISAYFKMVADTNQTYWTRITNATNTQLTLASNYPGGAVGPGGYRIAMLVAGSGSHAHVPGQDAQLILHGVPGGVACNAGAAPGVSQSSTDLPWYSAWCMCVYAGRMFLGVNQSCSTPTATPAVQFGMIAFSSLDSYREFNGATSGNFNLDTGNPHQMFVLRDTLYVVTTDGIESIQRTGNYLQPFRRGVVIGNRQFLPFVRPQVIDGTAAIVACHDGFYLFDGGGLRPLNAPLREQVVKALSLYGNPQSPTSQSSTFFEPKRKRFFVRGSTIASDWLVVRFDQQSQAAEKHKSTFTGNIVGFLPTDGVNLSTGAFVDDYIVVADDDIYALRSTLTTDTANTVIGSSASNTYWKSREIKFSTGRDDDNLTVDRFRLTWEATVPNRTSTHREVAANVATITTSAAHGFTTGQTVVITGLADSTYNGTRTIASTPTATTFTYSLTHANEGTTADTGGRITPTHNVTIELFSDGGTTAVSSSTVDLSLQQDGSTVTTSGLTYTKHVAVTPFTARSVVFKISQGSTQNLYRFKIKQFSIRTIRRSEGTPN